MRHLIMMFAKFRRRRSATATHSTHQQVVEPSLPPVPPVDLETLGRIERVRAGLARVIELDQSAEPEWFARVRAGETVSVTAREGQQVSDYLQGTPVEFVLSDAAVTDLLDRIEVVEELMELEEQGVKMYLCRGSIASAAAARSALALARQVQTDQAKDTPPRRRRPASPDDYPAADRP
ncbi:hypothetical protein ACFY1U_28715 [Streptomyces sp. NPDC001351]|uniref:hypothetical protein n=1 Tax=Streptomyces sp. NPDC001351 TaxID=3364564 RepID=UPI0036A3FAC9